MNDLISIIVPIYKVEAYLLACLESIQKQTYTHFEVLLINDGSPDNSESICLDFSQKDPRFKYFYKENGGVSIARNLGLEHATGKWIVFVDSDDTVEENYLRDFINNSVDDSVLVLQDFRKIDDTKITRKVQQYKSESILLPSELNKFISNYKFTQGYLWNKLFNHSIIKTNNLTFDKELNLCEDEIFYLSYIKFIHKIIVIEADNYNYINRESSLTSKVPQFEAQIIYLKYFDRFLDLLKININIEKYTTYKRRKDLFNFYYLLFTVVLKGNYTFKEKKNYLKKIQRKYPNISYPLHSEKSTKRKIIIILFRLRLYNFIVTINDLK